MNYAFLYYSCALTSCYSHRANKSGKQASPLLSSFIERLTELCLAILSWSYCSVLKCSNNDGLQHLLALFSHHLPQLRPISLESHSSKNIPELDKEETQFEEEARFNAEFHPTTHIYMATLATDTADRTVEKQQTERPTTPMSSSHIRYL